MFKQSCLMLPLLLPIGLSYAATATDTFTVQATVIDSCNIQANTLDFLNYDPVTASSLSSTTTIDVTCTMNTAYNIGLNAGTGTGATVTNRKMTNGANTLNYSLYQDSSHTTEWGDTIGTNTVSDTGTGALQSFTVYGEVFSNQTTIPSGTYSDTITITVTY